MQKLILVIVGMAGSGKSFAADLLVKHFNAKEVHSGDVIRDEVRARGLKYSPTADMAVAHWFHTGGREKLVAQRVWEKVKRSRKEIIIIEGLRSPSQLKVIEQLACEKPIIISITAPFRIRHEREHKRGRFGKAESEEYLRKRDKLELSHGVGKLMKRADYKVNNNGTTKQLENSIIPLVENVMQKYKYSHVEV